MQLQENMTDMCRACRTECLAGCSSSTACDADVNAVCTPLGNCVCKQGYGRVQGKCFPGTISELESIRPLFCVRPIHNLVLGTPCTNSDWCGVTHSHCNSMGICSCMPGFMQLRNKCKEMGTLVTLFEFS